MRNDAYLDVLLNDVDVMVNAAAWSSLWGNAQQSEALFYQHSIRLSKRFLDSQASHFVNISTTSAAWLMEQLDPLVPWEPLIVRSIVHLLEETGATNEQATAIFGYRPQHD